MTGPQIRFDDGALYQQGMGGGRRLVGGVFLEWLAHRPGLRWIDIGCGNGAFTELLIERCEPGEAQGIDPSGGQLAFARARPALHNFSGATPCRCPSPKTGSMPP